jgi:hypothetical protein
MGGLPAFSVFGEVASLESTMSGLLGEEELWSVVSGGHSRQKGFFALVIENSREKWRGGREHRGGFWSVIRFEKRV